MEKLLVVEDSEKVRCQLKGGLGGEYQVIDCADFGQGMEQFARHTPKLVLLDLDLQSNAPGGVHAFRCLEEMLNREGATKVVLLAGYAQRPSAYRALTCGAYDYCPKPVQLEDLRAILRRAQQLVAVEAERARLQKVLLHMLAEAPLSGRPEEGRDTPHQGETMPLLTLREAREMVERGAIMAAVDSSRGNLVKASEILGVCRPTLYDLMKKHGLHKSPRQVWKGEPELLMTEGAAG